MNTHKNTHLITHPLIEDRLSILRDKSCTSRNFRICVRDIAHILAIHATQNMALEDIEIETPMEKMTAKKLAGASPLIVPILRAGLGLSEGLQDILPEADTGHIGLYRNEETLKPMEYLVKLPADLNRTILICDPMLATAGSMLATIDTLLYRGAKERDITLITLVCAPEGLEALRETYKNIAIYTAAIDSHLNDIGYIVPGLGDAGDRFFGTD